MKRRRNASRLSPVRVGPKLGDVLFKIARDTGWSNVKVIEELCLIGYDLCEGNETRANNRKKYLQTVRELHAAAEKADEKLQPKRAAARAAAKLLNVEGPDIADASAIGKDAKKG